MAPDPLDRETTKIFEQLKRKQRFAWLFMVIENITLALWRPCFWALLFFGLWLFQLPSSFGQSGAILALVAFVLGLAYLFYKDLRFLRWPSAPEVTQRLERVSGLEHRPLSGVQDVLINHKKPETRSLWASRRDSLIKLLPQIHLSKPQAFMAEKDPYALRLVILLFFMTGLLMAGPHAGQRIKNGLFPDDINLQRRMASGLNVWITPPEYTHLEQAVLQGKGQGTLEIPQGTKIKANITSGLGRPVLYIDDAACPFEKSEDGGYSLEMEIPAGEHIAIRQMLIPLTSWDYKLIADTPPVLALKEEQSVISGGSVRFPLTVQDDYGVEEITMHMRLDPMVEEAPLGEDIVETRSVMSAPGAEVEISPVYNLAHHTWAGLPVEFTFEAKDHLGQTSITPPIKMVLPERAFTHPIAQGLIAERKKIIWAPEAKHMDIARDLEALLTMPSAFHDDIVVFLGLRTAASRLYYTEHPNIETSKAVIALLWNLALRVEDGNLSLAMRQVRDAQQALENLLRNPEATEEDIAEVMHDLRSALAEYMNELARELQKRIAEDGGQWPMISPEMFSQNVSPDALANFLNQLEQQMRDGNRDSAQDMLSKLQQFMDMLDPSVARPMPQDMQMMEQGIGELQELINRQEDLLQQTRRQTLNPDSDVQDHKVEQESLRYILGQLMLEADEKIGEIPKSMGLAEQEMRSSAEALGEGQPAQSVPHQEQALEYLKQAQQSLADQLMARMKQMTGMMLGGGRLDPLGRSSGNKNGNGNPLFGSPVKIPSDAERKRAQEVLELLRRRSGERDRPEMELQYYDRLLKQF